MDFLISRRAVLGSGMAAALVPTFSSPALSMTDNSARDLVSKVVRDINLAIKSGKSLSDMIPDFKQIFTRYSDVDIIARSTLGPAVRGLTPAQMRAYTDAFRGYIARKYGKRFQEFVGGRIEVRSVKPVKSWREVRTTAYLKGSQPFDVTFLVSDHSGKDRFFDMMIEGVSLRLTERTEIGSMLDRNHGNIDKLIADLRKAG